MIDYRLLVYLADTIGILLMIMVLVFGRRGRIGKDALPRADRLFHTTVYMNLGLCALDFPVFFLEGLDTPYTKDALYAVNTIQAVLLTSMTYVWLLYVLERTQFKTRRSHRLFRPIVIPLIGNIVIYMINFFVPVVYYISDDFHYTPDGVLYPLVLAVDFIYFVGSSIYGLIAMHHSKNYQFFPFIFVLIFTTAGSIIQALVYQASVIYLATSLAITAIFMESQNEKSYIDSLSRVFNRQYLNRYVTRLCSDSHSDQTFLMADIDSFKNINDTYGHQAGDQAIRDMGSILLEAAPSEPSVPAMEVMSLSSSCRQSIPRRYRSLLQNSMTSGVISTTPAPDPTACMSPSEAPYCSPETRRIPFSTGWTRPCMSRRGSVTADMTGTFGALDLAARKKHSWTRRKMESLPAVSRAEWIAAVRIRTFEGGAVF